MSFTCRMVVGYFDTFQVERLLPGHYIHDIVLRKQLNSDAVAQLQAVCDELFGIQLQLAEYLTEFGVLLIDKLSITQEMFKVACVAHELFDMAAVDDLHRTVVYPRPQPSQEEENFVRAIREVLPKDSLAAQCQAEAQQTEFENEVIRRVQAVRDQRRVERTNPSTS